MTMTSTAGFPLDSQPENTEITLQITSSGVAITNWISYSFDSNFLTPTDGWRFTMSGPQSDFVATTIGIGQQISLVIGGNVQCTGYIDEIEQGGNAESGTTITISGRDMLASMVDSSADPTLRFATNATLDDLVEGVTAPYGWQGTSITTDCSTDLLARTGAYGTKTTSGSTSKTGKYTAPKALKSYTMHLQKPFPGEGCFEFLARVCQRFGLWVWSSADGQTLIVSKPNFDVPPIYALRRVDGDTKNNILDAKSRRSNTEQPNIIVAEGFSGGGEFGKTKIRCLAINPCAQVSSQVTALAEKYPDAVTIPYEVDFAEVYSSPIARPMYIRDEDAKTQEELQNFVKKELALKMRKSFEYSCTVEGHTNSGAPWCVNATVDVQDDYANVHETLWILGVTFEKSRGGGTLTHLKLIRLYSLIF